MCAISADEIFTNNLGQELTLKLSPLLGFVGIIMLWYGIKIEE